MATAEQYAEWIVKNQDKRGSPEFETVASAYRSVKSKKPMQQIEPQGVGDPTHGMSGIGKFLAGVGKGMTDIAQGVGQNLGMVSREQVAESRKYDAPLMATGAGRAGEITGQIATALPTMFIPGANTVVGGGLVGAGIGLSQPSESTAETFQNIGMGGAGGGLGVLAGRAIPKALGAFVAPFTKSGSQRVAGDVLRRFSEGSTDDVIRSASNPSQLVAGSIPTLAEVAQNPGISTLQQALRGVSPTVNNAIGQRATDNLVARTSALRSIAGTADDMAQQKGVRDLMSESFYAAADKAKVPVTIRDRAISEIMERPSLKAAWGDAERLAREAGIETVTSKGELTGNGLHFLKMSLDSQIGAAKTAGKKTEADLLMRTKNALQGWMEKNIPEYGKARTAYAQWSKPINEMEVGKVLLNKLQPALMEGSRTPTRETAATFANAVRDAPRTIKGATGMAFENLDDVMKPSSANVVNNIVKDLQRKATSEDLAKTVGSNTAQNLASQQLLRNILGPMGLPQSWGESVISQSMARPVQFAMKGAEGRIQDVLGQAMLDPNFAAQIMKGAAPSPMGLLGRAYTQSLPAVGAGGLLAMQPR